AEHVALECGVSRADQDAFAYRSQQRAASAKSALADEIVPVTIKTSSSVRVVRDDEHPRPDTSPEALSKLTPIVRPDGTVTAGNASGINDGACAVMLDDADAAHPHTF